MQLRWYGQQSRYCFGSATASLQKKKITLRIFSNQSGECFAKQQIQIAGVQHDVGCNGRRMYVLRRSACRTCDPLHGRRRFSHAILALTSTSTCGPVPTPEWRPHISSPIIGLGLLRGFLTKSPLAQNETVLLFGPIRFMQHCLVELSFPNDLR